MTSISLWCLYSTHPQHEVGSELNTKNPNFTHRSIMIDLIKQHQVFTAFCTIIGIYVIVFVLCLCNLAKDHYED